MDNIGEYIIKEGHPLKDVPYTIGRLITTEDQGLKQQDTLPCYLFCVAKIVNSFVKNIKITIFN